MKILKYIYLYMSIMDPCMHMKMCIQSIKFLNVYIDELSDLIYLRKCVNIL